MTTAAGTTSLTLPSELRWAGKAWVGDHPRCVVAGHASLLCTASPALPAAASPQNDGRAAATTATLTCSALLWMNPLAGQCVTTTGAHVVAAASPFWVLEGTAVPNRFYIRSSACAAGRPNYLGFWKQACGQTAPNLFDRPTTDADLLWTVSLVSAGRPVITAITLTSAPGVFNILSIFFKPAPGPGACAAPLLLALSYRIEHCGPIPGCGAACCRTRPMPARACLPHVCTHRRDRVPSYGKGGQRGRRGANADGYGHSGHRRAHQARVQPGGGAGRDLQLDHAGQEPAGVGPRDLPRGALQSPHQVRGVPAVALRVSPVVAASHTEDSAAGPGCPRFSRVQRPPCIPRAAAGPSHPPASSLGLSEMPPATRSSSATSCPHTTAAAVRAAPSLPLSGPAAAALLHARRAAEPRALAHCTSPHLHAAAISLYRVVGKASVTGQPAAFAAGMGVLMPSGKVGRGRAVVGCGQARRAGS